MEEAGELDDRWLREKAGLKPSSTTGREESPDTALRQQRNALSASSKRMGNAPGNARGRGWGWRAKARRYNGVTESATENKPPRKVAAVTGGRETCSSSCKGAFAGKGETVG